MSGIYPPWNWQLSPENRPPEKEMLRHIYPIVRPANHKMSYVCIENPLTLFEICWKWLGWNKVTNNKINQHNFSKFEQQLVIWYSFIIPRNHQKKFATFHLSSSYWANPDWFPGTLRPAALPRLLLWRQLPPVVKERLYSLRRVLVTLHETNKSPLKIDLWNFGDSNIGISTTFRGDFVSSVLFAIFLGHPNNT